MTDRPFVVEARAAARVSAFLSRVRISEESVVGARYEDRGLVNEGRRFRPVIPTDFFHWGIQLLSYTDSVEYRPRS